jgi:hypothetical protein
MACPFLSCGLNRHSLRRGSENLALFYLPRSVT